MKRETISIALNGLDDRFISEAGAFSPGALREAPERPAGMKTRRFIAIALAAALLLALGITAYAVSGVIRSTGTNAMPKTASYSSLSDIQKVEMDVGYPVTAPESFSNGYGFAGLRVEGEAVFGENNEVLKEFYGVRATYSKPGAADRCLALSPVLELPESVTTPEPSELRTVNGVTVRLNLDHYKLAPDDYVKTEEDMALEAAGHYFINFGSEEIRECDYAFAMFELNGVSYVLMDTEASADTLDSLAQMAGELIDAIKG